MTEINNLALTHWQAMTALTWAGCHGHLWASLVGPSTDQVISWLVGGDIESLRQAAWAEAGPVAGIDSPIIDDGVVQWTTGTGRVQWLIGPDWARATVHRPGLSGPVLEVYGADDASWQWVDYTEPGAEQWGARYGTRHVDALHFVGHAPPPEIVAAATHHDEEEADDLAHAIIALGRAAVSRALRTLSPLAGGPEAP